MNMNYQPLNADRNQIRLIRLLPSRSQSASAEAHSSILPVRCTLENVSLDDYAPKYWQHIAKSSLSGDRRALKQAWLVACAQEADVQLEELDENGSTAMFWRFVWGDYVALSYVWGDRIAETPIIVNGVPIEVTENLEAALRIFYQKSDFVEGLLLWVDALCINQNDLAERSVQVKRMRDIFELAFGVTAWLGDEGEESDKAIRLLVAVASRNRGSTDEAMEFLHILRDGTDPFPSGSWRALYLLLSRPYWKRLWIIQEIAMSHTMLQLYCGNRSVYWLEMCQAVELITVDPEILKSKVIKDHEDVGLEYSSPTVVHLLERMQQLQMFSHAQAAGEDRPDLVRLLLASRWSEQRDSRDKVYGILGLMDASIVHHVHPSYGLSVPEVYTDFAKAIIRSTNKLDIICQSRANPLKQQDCPSWVPDWRRQVQVSLELTSKTPFCASGDRDAIVDFLEEGQMSCRGFRIDVVDGLGCLCWDPEELNHDIVQPVHDTNAYGDGTCVDTTVWQTLVAGRDAWGEPVPDWYRSLVEIPLFPHAEFDDASASFNYSAYNRFRLCNSTLQIFGREFQNYFPHAYVSTKPSITTWQLSEAVGRSANLVFARRLLITAGGFFGLAPKRAQHGDTIWVLLGCSTPVVLRPLGTRFKLIGECYVHGAMDGEFLEKLGAGECGLEDVILY